MLLDIFCCLLVQTDQVKAVENMQLGALASLLLSVWPLRRPVTELWSVIVNMNTYLVLFISLSLYLT